MTLSGFLLACAAIGFPALLIVFLEWHSRPRTDKHLDKLGPRALHDEFKRQREDRK